MPMNVNAYDLTRAGVCVCGARYVDSMICWIVRSESTPKSPCLPTQSTSYKILSTSSLLELNPYINENVRRLRKHAHMQMTLCLCMKGWMYICYVKRYFPYFNYNALSEHICLSSFHVGFFSRPLSEWHWSITLEW